MRIAIIGSGISGLYLAWKLSEKRREEVLVFEKKDNIDNKICSGLFSQRILEFLPQSQKLIQNKINFSLLHFPKKTIKIKFSKNFFVMSHSELNRLVASLALKEGAKIFFGRNISYLPSGFDRIIGCDGADSIVRKKLNLPNPIFRLGIQGFIKKEDFSDFFEVWPCQNGFLWRIPRGREVEYGIISNPQIAKKLFEDFLEKNNISLERINSRIIPQGLVLPVNPTITLGGDAAGLTKPWSGGGVIWGLSAAEILLKTFPDFLSYKKAMNRFFLPKIIFSKIAVKLVYFLGFKTPWLLPKNTKIESDFLL